MSSDPAFSRAGQQGATPPEPPAEEPRTETTLTTRISINIPGSRPIPPVVVRSPMPGAEDAADGTGSAAPAPEPAAPNGPRHRSGSGSSPVIGVMDSANGTTSLPDLPPEWRTPGATAAEPPEAPAADEPEAPSTWFAPRKKGQPAAPPAAAPTPAPTPPPAPAPAPTPPPGRQPFDPPAFQPPAFDQPQYEPPQYEPPMYEPVYEPPAAGQPGYEQPQPDFGRPVYQQQPYGPPETEPQSPAGPPTAGPARPAAGRPTGMNSGLIVGGTDAPAGPAMPNPMDTTMPLGVFRDPPATGPNAPAQASVAAPAPGFAPGRPQAPDRQEGLPQAPAGGRAPRAPRPSPRGSSAASAPPVGSPSGPSAPPRPESAGVGDGFAGGTGGAGAPPRKEGAEAQPATGKPAAKKAKAASRGRKLLVTAVGLLVLVAGVTYGAGLMLNQADVPKGTTVLGQNIGGDTRDAAVHTLDSTVGVQAAKPLQLVIGGKTVQLQTSVAGLSIDTTATVRGVAHHSYNPADVIGSLFGGTHPVPPVVHIDQDKLRSALQLLSSGSTGAKEGYVSFTESGDVVVVPPKAGKSMDVTAAIKLVRQAYNERAAGVPDHPITLPVTASEPKGSAAAVNAAAKDIGAYAAKNKFTVRVQGASQLFGDITFSKALTLRPDATGRIVPVFDLAQLKQAYGSTFDNVKATHNGVLGPVTPQDIATALTKLLTKADGSSLTVTLT